MVKQVAHGFQPGMGGPPRHPDDHLIAVETCLSLKTGAVLDQPVGGRRIALYRRGGAQLVNGDGLVIKQAEIERMMAPLKAQWAG